MTTLVPLSYPRRPSTLGCWACRGLLLTVPLLATTLVGGCSSDQAEISASQAATADSAAVDNTTAPGRPETQANTTTPADSVVAGSVGVEAFGCGLRPALGSGAVMARPGLVVTVAHTVAGADEITVIDQDANRHAAELRLLDPSSDIALLHVEGLAADPLPIGSTSFPAEAELLVWNRREGFRTKPVMLTRRLRVTIEDIYIDQDVQRTALEFAGSVDSGDSGGVLLLDDSIVAMVYARSRNDDDVGFALDERELGDALADLDALESGPVDPGPCVP